MQIVRQGDITKFDDAEVIDIQDTDVDFDIKEEVQKYKQMLDSFIGDIINDL